MRAQALKEHHAESLRRALSLGVKVVAGTDAGAWDHPHNARELECLVDAGMTPMQAIQAATGVAAECLDMQADIGTVQQGKLADLIAIDGDPLQDVRLLQDTGKLRLVMKGGVPIANSLSGVPATAPRT
jgi:imidazolonepropionase-like amidohydrolase